MSDEKDIIKRLTTLRGELSRLDNLFTYDLEILQRHKDHLMREITDLETQLRNLH